VQPASGEDGLAALKKWVHIDDSVPTLVVAATIFTNATPGEPVWPLTIASTC
jgi:hypothetical protein